MSGIVKAVKGVIGGVTGRTASKQAEESARQQQAQAEQAQAAQTLQANQAREQAAAIAAQQAQFEQDRATAQVNQTLGEQNNKTTNLTPTVQLAAQGDGDAGSTKTRARRAQFRPEYSSGVSI